MVSSMTTTQSQKNHVHAGDLKMRIHVGSSSVGGHGQSKQRKSSGGNGNMAANNTNGAAGHFTTSKSIRKASLAQRPSISSVRIIGDKKAEFDLNHFDVPILMM